MRFDGRLADEHAPGDKGDGRAEQFEHVGLDPVRELERPHRPVRPKRTGPPAVDKGAGTWRSDDDLAPIGRRDQVPEFAATIDSGAAIPPDADLVVPGIKPEKAPAVPDEMLRLLRPDDRPRKRGSVSYDLADRDVRPVTRRRSRRS